MDAINVHSYQRDGQHRYFGGEVRRSPFRLRVPQSGYWHVTIDLGGRSGTIRAGVRVFPSEVDAPA
ncbi:DUF1883 domain-containing protein [Bradyrhizobium erythrophlei]|uniref:DUF1883 domain-containing protein n=1 Tax=Bradyrhizobium erythrophlei TaxID=1437360 RepID=UPI0035E52D17